MARIDGVSDQTASFLQKRVFGVAASRAGAVPEPLRIMALSSGTMWGTGLFEMAFERAQSIEPKLKNLVSLKAAAMIGCVF